MSAENVKLVGTLQPPPGRDLATLFRDEGTVSVLIEAMVPYVDGAVASRFVPADGEGSANVGMDGLRQTWLDWLEPWATYRAGVQKLIDVGDQVLAISDDHAQEKGAEEEIALPGAAVWTVRGGKISALDIYADRTQAFQVAAALREARS